MKFCELCDNKMYIVIKQDTTPTGETICTNLFKCRNCGNEDTTFRPEDVVLYKIEKKQTIQSFEHVINEYTKFDPSLPRINHILCTNPDCDTNTNNKAREIIVIRYDNENLKYVYLCSTCNTAWTNTN